MTKPRMLYFQSPPELAKVNIEPVVGRILKCLSEFFEVVISNQDCDYDEVCSRHQPEITLFEGGGEGVRRLRVTNTDRHPQIPKVGLNKNDPHSHSKNTFLREMEQWGIETYFSWMLFVKEYFPEIAAQTYYWPQFVDTDLFRDYGQAKTIPVLFTGSGDGPMLEREWRARVKKRITERYPSLVFEHPGHQKDAQAAFPIFGEQYARTINASFFSPTCGAMVKTIVMKHLEIPGAKACLITERTPAVEAYGFKDMENCVFADEQEVLDKLDHLFAHRDELARITENGYNLVHTRHSYKSRSQIRQWLQLHRTLQPGQRIVQTGWFDDLKIVDEISPEQNFTFICGGTDRKILKQADERFVAGDYEQAEALYQRCLQYVYYMPEPILGVTLCKLHRGDAAGALDVISKENLWVLEWRRAPAPDPVEWAYFLVAILAKGGAPMAARCAKCFPTLHHTELERARWVTGALAGDTSLLESAEQWLAGNSPENATVHRLTQPSFDEFAAALQNMLGACGERTAARRLKQIIRTRIPAEDRATGQRQDLDQWNKPWPVEHNAAAIALVKEARLWRKPQSPVVRAACKVARAVKQRQ